MISKILLVNQNACNIYLPFTVWAKPLEIIYLKASNDLVLLLVVLPFRLLNNYTDHHIENQATAMS